MLSIVMPVWIQNKAVLQMTLEAVSHVYASSPGTSLLIITNRLHGCLPEDLEAMARKACPVRVYVHHEPGVERSVAGAWNKGCELAISEGAERIAIMANDVLVEEDTFDNLLAFDQPNVAVWSGIDTRERTSIDASKATDGADFACFMIRPDTIKTHGWFDARYRPAYFEDNDYYTRVVLGGSECRVVHAAKFFHRGSMTTRLDPEANHHVKHWWEYNKKRFSDKWGGPPAVSREDVLARHHKHPWNDSTKPLSWWERD